MALVVEDGTGLSGAESYCSVATADTYFASKRGDASTYASDWTAATTATKEAALRWATRLLDRWIAWSGDKATTTQALRWPRSGVYDLDGDLLVATALPADLVDATAEMARALIVDPERVEDQEIGLSSLGVGSIQLSFDKYDRPGTLPGIVSSLVSSLGVPRLGRSGMRYLERA